VSIKWVAKAVVQKGISVLPNAQRVNYVFQDRVTRSTTLSQDFLDKSISWAGDHLGALHRLAPDAASGFRAVELGSGWYPIVPLCLYLGGADHVSMLDLEDLGRPELTLQAMDGVLAAHDAGSLEPRIGPVDAGRVEALRQARGELPRIGRIQALAAIGLEIVTGDARRLDLPEPPQLICSNTVLEHIPAGVLEGILARFRDLSAPGTVMSHLIDLCDHYAYIDDTVNVYHFLRYSDRAWRVIDNSVQPMNRLRSSEYDAIYGRLGIPITEAHRLACDPLNLVGEPLDARFKAMDPADVACTTSWLITRFG
jgi:hypothetical protein